MLSRKGGYTLLELLFVVLIAGIIVSTVAKLLMGAEIKSKETAIKADLRNFQLGIETTLQGHTGLPMKDNAIDITKSEELINRNLDEDLRLESNQSIYKDPWGKSYMVEYDIVDGKIVVTIGTKGKDDRKEGYLYKMVTVYHRGRVNSEFIGIKQR